MTTEKVFAEPQRGHVSLGTSLRLILFVLPIGILVIWVANTVRIAALIALGTLVSPTIARGSFHSQAGWIAFSLIAMAMGQP